MISKKHLLSTVAVVPMTVGVALGLTSISGPADASKANPSAVKRTTDNPKAAKRPAEGNPVAQKREASTGTHNGFAVKRVRVDAHSACGACNPCGAKKCNPCGACNPCKAACGACNPCAAKKCNPCGACNPCKAACGACNPCAAKKCNPCGACNPCKAACGACNPCAAKKCNPLSSLLKVGFSKKGNRSPKFTSFIQKMYIEFERDMVEKESVKYE